MKFLSPQKPGYFALVIKMLALSGLSLSFLSLHAESQKNEPVIQAYQSHQVIQDKAKIFLEEMQGAADNSNIEILLDKLDQRLRLADCDGEIEAFSPFAMTTRGRTTVGVRCNGSVTWKVFIPAEIKRFQEVWITTRHLANSDTITQADVKRQKIDVNHLRRVPIHSLSQIVKTSPKQNLPSGSIIFEDSVCLVCQGEKVLVEAKNELLSISIEGISLADAGLGEKVQVRNPESKRIFEATVVGKNQLTINL